MPAPSRGIEYGRCMTRWLCIVMLATGCSAGSGAPRTSEAVTPSQPGRPSSGEDTATPSPSPEGSFVTEDMVYQGTCAPPGSRGGCHSITLHPDGRYTEWLYDAATGGTYTIDGDTVTLTASTPEMSRTLTFSADRSQLGELTRKP
jgi:hypothetical protein